MHLCSKSWYFSSSSRGLAAYAAGVLAALLSGCAAPGPPLPPTLNLPQVVAPLSLTATREGREVRLHWTTSAQTTDKLPVKGAIRAEICRDVVSGAVRPNAPCTAVARVPVTPGPSDAVDALPADFLAGRPRVLAYRIQLINRAGRTAGPSAAVLAASGPVVDPLEGFAGRPTKDGVELTWKPRPDGGSVELERTLLDPDPAKKEARSAGESAIAALAGGGKQAVETQFRAGAADAGAAPDAGGTVDRTVEFGHEYAYTAQRVIRVQVGGTTLEARSVPSAELRFAVRDVFAPDVPKGLVAVSGTGVSLELSWDPDVEPRLAGYRVYRRSEGSTGWTRVGPELVMEAAFRDGAVEAGHKYSYRVTAVSTAGNESAPSGEAAETAGQ